MLFVLVAKLVQNNTRNPCKQCPDKYEDVPCPINDFCGVVNITRTLGLTFRRGQQAAYRNNSYTLWSGQKRLHLPSLRFGKKKTA